MTEWLNWTELNTSRSFPVGATDREYIGQQRRHKKQGFDPGSRRFPETGKCQPTPLFFPGESHGQRSLVGYSPQGRKESDNWVTEHTYSVWGWLYLMMKSETCKQVSHLSAPKTSVLIINAMYIYRHKLYKRAVWGPQQFFKRIKQRSVYRPNLAC